MVGSIVKYIARIPLPVLRGILQWPVYFVLRNIVRYRRGVVERNLAFALPEMSDKDRLSVDKGFYKHLSRSIIETVCLAGITGERLMKIVNVDQSQYCPSADLCICYMAHLGNWEMIHSALGIALEGRNNYLVYSRQHNETVDRLLYEIRSRHGMNLVESGEVGALIGKLAESGERGMIFVLCDQLPPNRYVRYYHRFLGIKTKVITGTESLIRKYNIEPYYCSVRSREKGGYDCKLIPLGDWDKYRDSEFPVTSQYYDLLEKDIRREPERWLWSHDRWKR